MGLGFVRILSAAGIGSTIAISATLVSATTIKECKEAYAAHKDEAKAAGQSEKAYIANCRGASEVMAPGATTAGSHDAAPSPGPAKDKIGKACEADYSTNKAAVTDRGESKKDFLASCRAAMEAAQQIAAPESTASTPDSASK
jgi:hypothetical protein